MNAQSRSTRLRSHWCLIVVCVLVVTVVAPTQPMAVEEGLQELRLPPLLVESEIKPSTNFELPPPTYPVQRVEQLPFHGAWHEFVNATTGGLVFGMTDLRLPGHMPIRFGRVYDSKISDSLPPPPPAQRGQQIEARWTQDLGKNWILGYTAYLYPTGLPGVLGMATTEGDVVQWLSQGDGTFRPRVSVPSKHVLLEPDGPSNYVETQTDGTRWYYSVGVSDGASHALTKIEDRSGNYLEMVYDDGRLIEIKNSDGASLTVVRGNTDPLMHPVERVTEVYVTGDSDQKVIFSYYTNGQLASVTDVLNNTWDFIYTTNAKLISAEDPLDNVYLTASYDSEYRVSTFEGQNGPWSFVYTGPRTLVTDVYSNTWQYEHGTKGMTIEIDEPTGGSHELTLDADSNPSGYSDPEGVTVSWAYDSNHLPVSYTPAWTGANSITYTYDPDELWVDSVTSLDGGTTTFTRDAAGRVLEEMRPDGGVWSATYSPTKGDRLTFTPPLLNSWSFTYDPYGQIETATDPTGRVFEFEYTSSGDLEKFRRPDHEDGEILIYAEWVYDRDAAGRITGITDPLGNTWTRSYDDAGRLTEIQGPEGTTVEYGYDPRHRVTSSKVLDGVNDPETTYSYDAAGRLQSKTLPNGSVWSYGYDASSRLISITDPLSRTWTYTRDLAGRVTVITHPGGQQVTMTRDEAGRLTERTLPGGRTETFLYKDETGRLESAELYVPLEDSEWWSGTLEWTYDNMGRPNSITTAFSESGSSIYRALDIEYDNNGNRLSVTLQPQPLGEVISYQYDSLDRLTGTNSNDYADWAVKYDDISGHRTRISKDDWFKEWSYDLAGQLTDQKWGSDPEADPPVPLDGHIEYDYDYEGRLISVHDVLLDQTRTTTWSLLSAPMETTYSELGGSSSETTYEYDAAGLPVGRVQTVDSVVTDTWVVNRDAAGRPVYARHNDEIRLYSWDDNPEDPSAALRLVRSPTDLEDSSLELLYGFDGRLQEIVTHPVGEDPSLVAAYRWAPLVDDRVLEMNLLQEDDTYEVRRVISDVGGYYAEAPDYLIEDALVNPVVGVDQSDAALAHVNGATTPNMVAPFAMGAWNGVPNLMNGASTDAMSEFVTGLLRGRQEASLATREARSPAVSLGALGRPSFAPRDVTDDWLDSMLLGSGLVDDSDYVVADAAQAAQGSAGPMSGGSSGPIEGAHCYRGICWEAQNHPIVCMCDGAYTVPQFDQPLPWWFGCCPDPNGGGPIPPPLYGRECDFEFESSTEWAESIRHPDTSEGGVSLVNGQYIKTVTDLNVFGGRSDIPFTRTYRSGMKYLGNLGYRWVHNWTEMIVLGHDPNDEECGNVARWVSSTGGIIDFWIHSNGLVDYPEESVYRIRKFDDENENPVYEMRHVNGSVRRFEKADETGLVFRLSSIKDGDEIVALDYDPAGKLSQVSSQGVPRLGFDYDDTAFDGTPLLTQVTNLLDPTEWVQFVYDDDGDDYDCNELTKVLRPHTRLKESETANHQPVVNYTYDNVNGEDCLTTAAGMHLLTSTTVEQFDPINDSGGPQRTVSTGYCNPAADPPGPAAHCGWKVRWQCIGDKSCAGEESADLVYDYTHAYPMQNTLIEDRRIAGQMSTERHAYLHGQLMLVVEDEGGLHRTTEFGYNEHGLRTAIRYADGTGEMTEYVQVGGTWLPATTTIRTAENWGGPPVPGEDIVTHRTYEGFRGLVRTITGPEAFSLGEVPEDFAPHVEGNKEYTQFFVYDFDEGVAQDGAAICADWDLPTCPSTDLVDLNQDTSDDANWYGNTIRAYRWLAADQEKKRQEHELATVTTFVADGRPASQVQRDGVKTEYLYYDNISGWDWRDGDSYEGPANLGPLAAVVLSSPDPLLFPDLERKYAWSARHLLLAAQNPQGLRTEQTIAASGSVLTSSVSCDPDVDSECVADSVLHATHFTYDLRGRLTKEQVFGADTENPIRETWSIRDDLGRPVSVVVDPESGSTPEPRLDLTTKYFYDGRGRISKQVNPAGRTVCHEYDALNRVTAIRRRADLDSGNSECGSHVDDLVSQTIYDAMDRPVVHTDVSGAVTYSWYDGHGRPEYTSDGEPSGAFPPVVLGESLPEPLGAKWYRQTSRDIVGRPSRERFFGRRDLTVPEQDGFMHVSWRAYDELGRPFETSVGVSDGYIPEEVFEQDDPPAEPINGFSLLVTRQFYNAWGQQSATEDAYQRETNYEYDLFGRLSNTLFPANRLCTHQGSDTSTSCYHDQDCLDEGLTGPCVDSAVRDMNAAVYDHRGRVVASEETVHDPEEVPQVRRVEFVYDQWGRVIREVGAPSEEDLVTDFMYNELGEITLRATRWEPPEDPLSDLHDRDLATAHEYDNAGRIKRVRRRESGATWSSTQVGYYEDGLTKWLRDANGNQTDWSYDDLGRVEEMLLPSDGDHRQRVSISEYEADRPKRITFIENAATPASLSWVLGYDDRGRLDSRTVDTESAGELEFAGTTAQAYGYDDLGRMIRAEDTNPDYPGESIVAVELTYDSMDRVIEENQPRLVGTATVDHRVQSQYDLRGFRTQLEFPDHSGDAYSIGFKADSLGRLASIYAPTAPSDASSSRVRVVEYAYVGNRVWSRRYRNGAELRMYDDGIGQNPWDPLGRPKALRTVDSNDPATNVITDFRFGYDRVGRLSYEQRVHEPISDDPQTYRTRVYATDQMGRMGAWREGGLEVDGIAPATLDTLALLDSPSDGERWELDPTGNWSELWRGFPEPQSGTTFTVNELNQYESVDPDGIDGPEAALGLVHDWLGQLRQDDTKSRRYVWDAFGRLSEITDTNTPPNLIARYRYDALNRRIEKHLPGTIDQTTRFVYDGWRAIEERVPAAGSGWVVRARYGFGRTLDGILWMDRDVAYNTENPPRPDPINGTSDGIIESRLFAHHDFRGSVVALTNDALAGPITVVERFTYDAYGGVRAWLDPGWNGDSYSGIGDSRSQVGLPYLYTGQRHDPESDLLYSKNRFYDPSLGRFVTRDPIGLSGGINLYQYAGSSPQMASDPLGLTAFDPWGGGKYSCGYLCSGPRPEGSESWTTEQWSDWHDSNPYNVAESVTATATAPVNDSLPPLTWDDLGCDLNPYTCLELGMDRQLNVGSLDRENGGEYRAASSGVGTVLPEGIEDFTWDPRWEDIGPGITDPPGEPAGGGTIGGRISFAVHLGLDIAGTFPLLGNVADTLNAIYYLAEGDYVGAGSSALAAIPGFGVLVTSTKLAVKAERAYSAARGGTYVLRNSTGRVMRSGRTNNLARRAGEHARHPDTRPFDFEPMHYTDSPSARRGLEQMIHDQFNPPLNKIRPISPKNKNRAKYMNAADEYLATGGTP